MKKQQTDKSCLKIDFSTVDMTSDAILTDDMLQSIYIFGDRTCGSGNTTGKTDKSYIHNTIRRPTIARSHNRLRK